MTLSHVLQLSLLGVVLVLLQFCLCPQLVCAIPPHTRETEIFNLQHVFWKIQVLAFSWFSSQIFPSLIFSILNTYCKKKKKKLLEQPLSNKMPKSVCTSPQIIGVYTTDLIFALKQHTSREKINMWFLATLVFSLYIFQ